MTQDHIEDFIAAMRREGVPFLVMVPIGNKFNDCTAYRVSSFMYDDGPGSGEDMLWYFKRFLKDTETEE